MSKIEYKILKNAAILISEEGLSSFSFTKLSKMCCCSKSTLYHNYNSKEDVIMGIYINNINEIVSFNKTILSNHNLSVSEKMILACMFDVFRVFLNYSPADSVSMIASTSAVNNFSSKYLFSQLKIALTDLNETFDEVESMFIKENMFKEQEIKPLLNTYRIHARGIVGCVSNKVYFNSCINAPLKSLYNGYLSILNERIKNDIKIDFNDIHTIINNYLLKREGNQSPSNK
ncbi:TetR/AcrR family transcriptional regulator [Shewanella psychrotolerans]|uniref:TetR/AcrR family transcriptional regulator n=1 Tax=Shewanella psychrotolerans TaxID=2864206 RepID=UPI001C65A10B|nr:TetR/AcrR family transcriptional regulator [Shewanella psychrotolerans]QYK00462.1 TetR family transcriptional regulator [Shewanella psychrotolerans]